MSSKTMSKVVANAPTTGAGTTKPVPMKLFATWEVDRTPSNCVPRLCSLTLTHLVVLKPLGNDLTTPILIAVKMQSSKRTLRSNEISLPSNGLLDTSLELTFSLQYPHFLKRDGNRLQILLQRRKRYKNRTMLGFKTLAEGVIRMDQVLQKPMDLELELVSDSGGGKDKGGGTPGVQTVAKLTIIQLSSTPVDQDTKMTMSIVDRGFSDEEEEGEFTSGEEEGQDMSDSEPIRNKFHHTRHNFKQRFVSLLRRFRQAEDRDGTRCEALAGATSDIQAFFNELDSFSCDEESGGEQDTMSVSSTPKPSLRPFFSSCKSLLDNQLHNDGLNNYSIAEERNQSGGSDGNPDMSFTDLDGQQSDQGPPHSLIVANNASSPPKEKIEKEPNEKDRKSRLFRTDKNSTAKKKYSISINQSDSKFSDISLNYSNTSANTTSDNVPPRKSFLNSISKTLAQEETTLPEWVALVQDSLTIGGNFVQSLEQLINGIRIINPVNSPECRLALQTVFNKINKYISNNCTKPISSLLIKVILIGGDGLTSACLRHYVDLLSGKPSEWQNYLRFYIIPIGTNCIARQLSLLDSGYATLFQQDLSTERGTLNDNEMLLLNRIQRYVGERGPINMANLSLAEAMLTCHDESSQIFIPFVAEVRIGAIEVIQSVSLEIDDLVARDREQVQSTSTVQSLINSSGTLNSLQSSQIGSVTTIAQSNAQSPPSTQMPSLTPPSSPNVQVKELLFEPFELQIDYWLVTSKQNESSKNRQQDSKNSIKGSFKSVHVCRLPGSQYLSLTVHFATKEKKQKIMRLGKKKEKDKETEVRNQTIDGITRLICSSKASHLKVFIDGAEWNGVKFFQLSPTWQTHVKQFNAALTSYASSPDQK